MPDPTPLPKLLHALQDAGKERASCFRSGSSIKSSWTSSGSCVPRPGSGWGSSAFPMVTTTSGTACGWTAPTPACPTSSKADPRRGSPVLSPPGKCCRVPSPPVTIRPPRSVTIFRSDTGRAA